ncbi:MAG: DUF3037 domain-containing protein [Chloroflexota bacterium]|nr:DUF3037 domain-containing protein [Chloroflexota bacterium]
MIPARYAVIRYVADPARNEPVNVGIVLWNDVASRLRLDEEALARVVRGNPHLSRDALHYLDQFLRARLVGDRRQNGSQPMEDRIQERSQFPVLFTESRLTTVRDASDEALDAELAGLVARIVRPSGRQGGGARPGVAGDLAKRWKPWLGTRLLRNHVFEESKTGVPRMVNFYANSGADIAVDIVRLVIRAADDIQHRADAEAFKVEDVLARHDVRFLVHCDLHHDQHYAQANNAALRTIAAAGATVLTRIEDTAAQVEATIGVS